jgi:ankyrin repeat protein
MKAFILIDQLCLENPADVLLDWTGTDKTHFIPSGSLSQWDAERKSLLGNPSKHRLFILSAFIKFGSTLQVERLLNKWNFMDQIHETQHDGRTVLIVACISGKADIATLFCDCGIDVNRADVQGWTALHYAAGLGHPQIVKLLVKHSALINKKTNEGYTPLKVAKRSLLPASCPEQAKNEILEILSAKH